MQLFKSKIQSQVIDFEINLNLKQMAILSKKNLNDSSFYTINFFIIENEGII